MGDSDLRHVGTVDRTQKISRGGDTSLQSFGLVGYMLSNTSTPTNLYVVKVASGELISAQSDDEFTVGDCVEVIPSRSARSNRSYAFGEARIERSERCKPSAR